MKDDQQESRDEAAQNEIEKQFADATGGLRMPPAPKSKVVPKFDFDAMSSGDGSSEGKLSPNEDPVAPQQAKTRGAFGFGMMMSDDEQDEPEPQLRLPA